MNYHRWRSDAAVRERMKALALSLGTNPYAEQMIESLLLSAWIDGSIQGSRKVIDGRDLAQAGLAEATEVAAELTVAWAAAVGEGVIPCTEDCGTKGHLGTAASAACRKALDRWREMERGMKELRAELSAYRNEMELAGLNARPEAIRWIVIEVENLRSQIEAGRRNG